MNKPNLDELRAKVRQAPGAAEYVELAELLIEDASTRTEGREVLLAGLNVDPRNARARLQLARSYYLDGYSSFCARELKELRRFAESPALDRLIDAYQDFFPESDRPLSEAGEGESLESSSIDDSNAGQPAESARPAGKSMEEIFGELDLDADFDEIEVELEEK